MVAQAYALGATAVISRLSVIAGEAMGVGLRRLGRDIDLRQLDDDFPWARKSPRSRRAHRPAPPCSEHGF